MAGMFDKFGSMHGDTSRAADILLRARLQATGRRIVAHGPRGPQSFIVTEGER